MKSITIPATLLLAFACSSPSRTVPESPQPTPREATVSPNSGVSTQRNTEVPGDVDPLTGLPFTIDVAPEALADGAPMPADSVFDGFGCSGGNTSPGFSWQAAAGETKSYAVMMYDPDAPTGVGFHHWWIANLSPATTRLERGAGGLEGTLPAGAVQGRNDYGTSFYGGPCPPEGRTHRYQFTVWALDVDSLPLDKDTSPAVARFMIRQHATAAGRFVRTYGR